MVFPFVPVTATTGIRALSPSANIVEVSKLVNKQIPTLQSALGSDVTMTVVFDQAPFIQKSIESLTTEGLLGLVFAVIIILLFLLSVRSTLVTAISIPTSVLITFIGLGWFGYSIMLVFLGVLMLGFLYIWQKRGLEWE